MVPCALGSELGIIRILFFVLQAEVSDQLLPVDVSPFLPHQREPSLLSPCPVMAQILRE